MIIPRTTIEVHTGRFDFGLTLAEEERATELHRDSIVVDLAWRYAGGSIFSHYPADLQLDLKQRLASVTGRSAVLSEAIYWPFEMSYLGRSDLLRKWLHASGITCGSFETMLHADPNVSNALEWNWEEKLRRYEKLPWLRYVTTARQIRQAKVDNAIAVFANCQPTVPGPRTIAALDGAYERGLRSFMLTYNRMDHIGVGCTERVDAGLSMFGIEIVERCNELGIIVDVSHCGHLTTLDACRYSTSPVTANHTSAKGLCAHARGKSDDEIKAVAGTNGVIGVVAVPSFLTARTSATIEDMLDHMDYIARLVGWQHVAIGSDWPWPVPNEVLLTTLGTEDIRSAGFRPEDRIDRTKRLIGFDSSMDLPNITRGLVKRGYSDEQIRGILGENALRVFEDVCG